MVGCLVGSAWGAAVLVMKCEIKNTFGHYLPRNETPMENGWWNSCWPYDDALARRNRSLVSKLLAAASMGVRRCNVVKSTA